MAAKEKDKQTIVHKTRIFRNEQYTSKPEVSYKL